MIVNLLTPATRQYGDIWESDFNWLTAPGFGDHSDSMKTIFFCVDKILPKSCHVADTDIWLGKVSKYIDYKRQILLTHNFFFIDVFIEEM